MSVLCGYHDVKLIYSLVKDVRIALTSKELKERMSKSRKESLGEGLKSRERTRKKSW